jgi:hypothetical protein
MKPTGKTTPRSVFNSLSMRLTKLTDEGDPIALHAYVNSSAFREGLRMIAPEHLAPVLKLYAQARAKCDAKLPLIKRGDGSRRKWTPERIAKFRRALAQTGSLEGAARICGLTVKAARLARKRYLDAPATKDRAQAA